MQIKSKNYKYKIQSQWNTRIKKLISYLVRADNVCGSCSWSSSQNTAIEDAFFLVDFTLLDPKARGLWGLVTDSFFYKTEDDLTLNTLNSSRYKGYNRDMYR